MKNIIKERLQESIRVKESIINNSIILDVMSNIAEEISNTIKNGNKIILCGNGGSASDALHFAGEIIGRFQKERPAWPAVVLNSDVATITAIANDYGYKDVFARQAEAHVNAGDVFIGISTTGNSENVYCAAETAKRKGAKIVAFLGGDGGKLGSQADYPVIVPCNNTARIQESHITLIHIICEIIEEKLG